MTEQTNQMEHVKVLIIGSGPAGYTAARYTGRASLQPVLYCGPLTGGQLTQTTEIENFPGYPQGVDANQMMLEFREQAERFGADIRDGEDSTKALMNKYGFRHYTQFSRFCKNYLQATPAQLINSIKKK